MMSCLFASGTSMTMTDHWRSRLVVALAALLLGTLPATAQYATLSPPGEGFSVQFAAQPTFHPDTPSRDIIAHFWTGAGGGHSFFMGRGVTKNDLPINAFDDTFKADQEDVVTNYKGTLVRSERIEWPGPDGPLPALLFTMRVGDGYGEWLETIRGKFVFAIYVSTPADSPAARDEVDRLVRTLRITQ
jgi:hypothetical protein